MSSRTHLPLLGAVFLTSIVLVLMSRYWLAQPDISDSIGYIQASHQLARGQGLAYVDSHNRTGQRYYTLYAFKVVHPQDPNLYFGLPVGVPVLTAILEKLIGSQEPVHWFVPATAALLVLSTFSLGTLLFEQWTGFWAALVLATTTTFVRFSSAMWTETPTAAFLYLGGILSLIALRRKPDLLSKVLAAIGGLTIGATFFIRFSNVTAAFSLPVLVWSIGGLQMFSQRRVGWLAAPIVLSLLAWLTFNALYYGGPLTTGYSPLHGWYDQPAFSLAYAFGASFVNGHSMPAIGLQLIQDLSWWLVFAMVGLASQPHRAGLWLLSLAVLILAPYGVYAFAAEGINARFIIPALPALCLLIGRGIVVSGHRLPHSLWRWIVGATLLVGLLYTMPAKLQDLQVRNKSTQANIQNILRMVEPTEPNAVVLSYSFNDVIAVYGKRSVLNYRHMPPYDPVSGKYRGDQFESLLLNEITQLLDQNIPVYYVTDRQPSLYKSEEILRQNFEFAGLQDDLSIFRVKRRGS